MRLIKCQRFDSSNRSPRHFDTTESERCFSSFHDRCQVYSSAIILFAVFDAKVWNNAPSVGIFNGHCCEIRDGAAQAAEASGGVKPPRHPVYTWTVLEEARRARGMLRSFLLVYHVCHKGAVPGCIITARARHTARFIRERHSDYAYGRTLALRA